MVDIGTKLQVPPHTDEKAWMRFYDQVTAPGYATDISVLDPKRDVENQHWVKCQLKRRALGCERCEKMKKRVPVVNWNGYGKN